MTAAAHFDPLPDGLFGGLRASGFPHRIRQCLQVVVSGLRLFHGQPDYFPSQRCGQPLGVRRTQVVAVRLDVGRERPEHGSRVTVDIGEGANGRLLAGGAGATTVTHGFTSLGPPRSLRWHRPYPAPGGNAITSDTPHVRVLATRASAPGDCGLARASIGDVRNGRPVRRDRHGRGLRGPLAPADVPLSRTRAQRFDDLVLDAVSQLESRWEQQLAGVEFAVEEVPPAGPGPVPVARLEHAAAGEPTRIVVYRRPAQARAEGDDELAALVFDAVVEEVARLLGIDPENIDPGYDGED